MGHQAPKTARFVAMTVLNRFRPQYSYAGPILSKLLPQTAQKQQATDIVFGTVRNAKAIDMVISQFAGCPVERIPSKLLNIIRIGAYELIFTPATAEYAIVNEAVENTKTVAGKKQVGFVNAALRQITRHIKNRQIPLSGTNPRRTLPQTPSTGCEFDICFLPDPAASPADYLSTVFSLPEWLVADWLTCFGVEKTRQICFAGNRRPSVYLRPNTLKTTICKIAEKFRQADINFEILDDETMIKAKSPQAVEKLPGFAKGLFTVQDVTASQPLRTLAPQPAQTILDLCAAPGTKTTQLAELTGDSAKIVATDIDSRRLEKVKKNTARLGISSVETIAYEQLSQKTAEVGPFDSILLDVPCSNTGVLAKRPEVRYRIEPGTIKELAKVQARLLETAAAMVKPKGKICYSTCSIQKCENSELVRCFLRENRGFELESEKLILPSAEAIDCDGGYMAIITKK